MFIFSAVLDKKSDDPLHIDNIPNVFVFKKTPVSKGAMTGYKNDRKVHLQTFHQVLILLMKAQDTNTSIKSRKVNFPNVFLVSIYIS